MPKGISFFYMEAITIFSPNNGIIYPIITKYSKINKLYEFQDLEQEAYISCLYAKANYNAEYNVKYSTYLGMVVNHYLYKKVNYKNLDTSSLNVPISEDYEVVDLIEDDNTIDFMEVLFQSELKQLLRERMEILLTSKEREVLHYYYWDNLTQEAISDIYGYSKSNVQRYLNQGLRKLRRDPQIPQFYKDNINEDYTIR